MMSTWKMSRKLSICENRKEWSISGEHGSIAFWVIKNDPDVQRMLGELYTGGVETHYRKAPEYMDERKPSQEICHLNHGPCWHDGTSLWAREYWIPYILPQGDEAIWQRLEQAYLDRLGGTE